jgi:hypothetical protein
LVANVCSEARNRELSIPRAESELFVSLVARVSHPYGKRDFLSPKIIRVSTQSVYTKADSKHERRTSEGRASDDADSEEAIAQSAKAYIYLRSLSENSTGFFFFRS